MAFSNTILVSVTVFTDIEFSIIDHDARNLLICIFLYQQFMTPQYQRKTDN